MVVFFGFWGRRLVALEITPILCWKIPPDWKFGLAIDALDGEGLPSALRLGG